ncbi:MAG: hypothetical protein WCC99_11270 [Candidatus Sulfotelmatobacter sp.]
MTEPDTIPPVGPLIRRWAPPIIAAWLLHMGVWMFIVSVAEPPVLSMFTKIVNWFIELFTARAWPIEELSWSSRFTAYQTAESLIPIFVGLLIGWWVLRRNTGIRQQSR